MTALLPLSSFDQILGPIVIGSLISTAIWGITCVQTYSFFTGHSMDTRVFKASIVFLWLLDTTDTIFICHVIYYYCVTSFLNPIAVVVPIWSAIDKLPHFDSDNLFGQYWVNRHDRQLLGADHLHCDADQLDFPRSILPNVEMFTSFPHPLLVYLNSYLAVLNARQGLRDELDNRSPFPLPIISAGGIGSQTPSHRTVPLNQSLFMQDQYSGLIPTHDHPPHGVSISVETISDRSRIGDKDSELAKKSR
ncbi:hypothetical protein D9758_005267 [Tetrapyrgos nigripes]|uniref:Uncharacterized protein n=1 Tax=Tetrapyrgos nigripes TaxID=182062 RepID=A0A8H5GXH5_9AGAR|nr:hypothetical protein D9758_005267 [Tetrapyrgos nigripes]